MSVMIVAIMDKDRKKLPKIHLEIQKHRKNCYGLIRSSYREDGKVKHTNHGRISGLNLNDLKLIQLAIRGLVIPKNSAEALHTSQAKEYGGSFALLELAKKIGLDKAIYSRPQEQWVKDSLAMIIGRIIYQGSKLSLTNEYKNTALWELCSGIKGKVDVDKHCYEAMDELLKRQGFIQQKLINKHINKQENNLILYDITSSYFEGEYQNSDLVKFGYNRDNKKGHEQIVIGLICNEVGCPVATEVFSGNTQDAQTVEDKIQEIKNKYGIKDIIFVGDRGMVTKANNEKLNCIDGLKIISALTHPQIRELLKRKEIQLSLFDERKIVEIIDSDDENRRYCLCKNLDTASRETKTRNELLDKTRKELEKIKQAKRKSNAAKIGARVGKVLQKYKMGKFIDWYIENEQLIWTINTDKAAEEQLLDGCYIIWTDVEKELLNKEKVVAAYKNLRQVETAFANIKTVLLELRPIYHKTDNRIKSHVFICMLAYYLQWHFNQKLQPLFQTNSQGKNREWTLQNVIRRLTMIHHEKAKLNGIEFDHVSAPENDQQYILDLLEIKL